MSDLGFTWNQSRTVQKKESPTTVTNEKMSSKQVVQNPNRISIEQVIAALCVCVGELCEVVEAQARMDAAKMEIARKSLSQGEASERNEPTRTTTRRVRSKTTDPSVERD